MINSTTFSITKLVIDLGKICLPTIRRWMNYQDPNIFLPNFSNILIGRDVEKKTLISAANNYRWAYIYGQPGVGKTTLSLNAITSVSRQKLRTLYPGGIFYFDFREENDVDGIIRAFVYRYNRSIKEHLHHEESFRSAIQRKKMLIILNGCELSSELNRLLSCSFIAVFWIISAKSEQLCEIKRYKDTIDVIRLDNLTENATISLINKLTNKLEDKETAKALINEFINNNFPGWPLGIVTVCNLYPSSISEEVLKISLPNGIESNTPFEYYLGKVLGHLHTNQSLAISENIKKAMIVLSIFSPKGIPVDFLQSLLKAIDCQEVSANDLTSTCLLKLNKGIVCFCHQSYHRYIRKYCAREILSRKELQCVLRTLFDDKRIDTPIVADDYQVRDIVISHLSSVSQHLIECYQNSVTKYRSQILACAYYMINSMRYKEAEDIVGKLQIHPTRNNSSDFEMIEHILFCLIMASINSGKGDTESVIHWMKSAEDDNPEHQLYNLLNTTEMLFENDEYSRVIEFVEISELWDRIKAALMGTEIDCRLVYIKLLYEISRIINSATKNTNESNRILQVEILKELVKIRAQNIELESLHIVFGTEIAISICMQQLGMNHLMFDFLLYPDKRKELTWSIYSPELIRYLMALGVYFENSKNTIQAKEFYNAIETATSKWLIKREYFRCRLSVMIQRCNNNLVGNKIFLIKCQNDKFCMTSNRFKILNSISSRLEIMRLEKLIKLFSKRGEP